MVFQWSPPPPEWSNEELSLLPVERPQIQEIQLATLIANSDCFPCQFPINTNRCKTLKSQISETILERNINSAYPIVHENVLHLYARFILHKRQHGSSIEKSLYKEMNLLHFIDRLLKKRAVSFLGKRDHFILLNGKKGSQKWETIGTLEEKPPLILKDCLSYEEIKLSAFLSVSSYSYFVNVGDRKNMGVLQNERGEVQDEGVIIGLIGPRLVKEGVMDYQEIVINGKQNVEEKGYGNVGQPTIHQLFANFYQDEALVYKLVNKTDKERFIDLKKGEIFDIKIYSKRLTITIDTLLIEANYRASECKTSAYIHVVGIGLGLWRKSTCQNKLFMDCCGQRLKTIGQNLHYVSDICFAYINHNKCLDYNHGDVIPIEGHPSKGIKIHICKREPHAKLKGVDKDKLLVVSYAWDGNALPGNEFWNKKLGSSGDSAAASSTQVAELHNPFINAKVCGSNLRVVAGNKVVDFWEYLKILRKMRKRS